MLSGRPFFVTYLLEIFSWKVLTSQFSTIRDHHFGIQQENLLAIISGPLAFFIAGDNWCSSTDLHLPFKGGTITGKACSRWTDVSLTLFHFSGEGRTKIWACCITSAAVVLRRTAAPTTFSAQRPLKGRWVGEKKVLRYTLGWVVVATFFSLLIKLIMQRSVYQKVGMVDTGQWTHTKLADTLLSLRGLFLDCRSTVVFC